MSYKTRRELLLQIVPRYRESDRVKKRSILDEFVASTGYSRKYAIRLLASKQLPVLIEIKRPRPHYYGAEELETLKLARSAANFISSKMLAPFLKELIPSLEGDGHLTLSEQARKKIPSISALTIDRLVHRSVILELNLPSYRL